MLVHLHSYLTIFPLPILFLSFICEGASYFGEQKNWRYLSSIMIFFCAIFSISSYYSGLNQSAALNTEVISHQQLIESHQGIAKIFLITLIPTLLLAILRNLSGSEIIHWCFVPFLVASIITSGLTTYKGISMVLDHGIGVKITSNNLQISIEK